MQCLWKRFKLLGNVAGTDIRDPGGPQTLPKVLGDLLGRWKMPSCVPTVHYIGWEKIVIIPGFWI